VSPLVPEIAPVSVPPSRAAKSTAKVLVPVAVNRWIV
jgi:hypothetical protein